MGKKTCESSNLTTLRDHSWRDKVIENAVVITRKLIQIILIVYVILFMIFMAYYFMGPVNRIDTTFVKTTFAKWQTKLFFFGGTSEKLWSVSKETFIGEMHLSSKEFPFQNRDTWLQLRSTIGKTLNPKEPKYPAVITVLIPPTVTVDFAQCFLRNISFALNKAVAPILQKTAADNIQISPLYITSFNFTQASITEIRENIESYLKSKGKAIIVKDIDKFQREHDLLMFHGLCDNYHAVDVRATILFSVQVPPQIFQKYSSWNHVDGGKISNEVLSTAWANIVGESIGPALIARIADAVILLNDGDTCLEDSHFKSDEITANNVKEMDQQSDESTMDGKPTAINEQIDPFPVEIKQTYHDIQSDYLASKTETEQLQIQYGTEGSKIIEEIHQLRSNMKQKIRQFEEEMQAYQYQIEIKLASLIKQVDDLQSHGN